MVALALTGCSTAQTGSGTEGEPPLGVVQKVDSSDDITLPEVAYTLTDQEDRTVQRAIIMLAAKCGDRFGVRVTMQVTEYPPDASSIARRYYLIDAGDAARYGYHVPPPAKPPTDDKAADGWDPTEQELAVLDGGTSGVAAQLRDANGSPLPEGGCLGEAYRALGEDGTGEHTVDQFLGGSYDRAETDSRVVAATAAWSDCMKRSGYSYQSPPEPNNLGWPEAVGAEEIATAVADVACKVETNLVGIWMAVEAAYQQREIEAHAEEMSNIMKVRDEMVRRASQALGGS